MARAAMPRLLPIFALGLCGLLLLAPVPSGTPHPLRCSWQPGYRASLALPAGAFLQVVHHRGARLHRVERFGFDGEILTCTAGASCLRTDSGSWHPVRRIPRHRTERLLAQLTRLTRFHPGGRFRVLPAPESLTADPSSRTIQAHTGRGHATWRFSPPCGPSPLRSLTRELDSLLSKGLSGRSGGPPRLLPVAPGGGSP